MARTHGLGSTYRSGCRCRPCTDANTRDRQKQRLASGVKVSAEPGVVQHGRASTYENWRCRCEPCTEDHARKNTARSRARKAVIANG